MDNFSINDNEQNIVIDKEFLCDTGFLTIQENYIDTTDNWCFKECDFEFNSLSQRNINKFLKKSTFENCRFFLGHKFKNKVFEEVDGIEFIYETFLEHTIRVNESNLTDLDEENIKKIHLANINLKDVILPKNKNFFNLIRGRRVYGVTLPLIDFTQYDVNGVNFQDCKFNEETILPNDFFQKIRGKTIIGCKLPIVDFNNMDIRTCSFHFIKFHKKTIFPKRDTFFKEFSILSVCQLPKYDYRDYSFHGVKIVHCTFPENSKIPLSKQLVNNVVGNNLPKSFIKYVNISPLTNEELAQIEMRYGTYMSNEQKVLMRLMLEKNTH